MEDKLAIIALAVSVLAFVPAIWCFFSAVSHFIQMLQHTKGGRQDLAMNLLPFIFTFSPSSYTPEGQVHLRQFGRSLVGFGLSVLLIALIYAATGVAT